ncbi:hypothetical protein BU14_0254s0006 [Porphyra umbilicalis]|uniref:Ubiquitin-like protease family profile domain-containing protein n=1 Tax=Porphyra umbilicalis TaxID=2786 RepID=A0A1X6P2X9_PORUM|nr:hypothetical protein BU14_0254s0006 [Porphyra umbilicalis]|eukprot:OSX75126.1 hypothetical protein BU14_0254s0006 [Porphyra umbilicalis]
MGRQLIGTVVETSKITGVYLVVECGGGEEPTRDSTIIDCSAVSKSEEEKQSLMDEWASRRPGGGGSQQGDMVPAASTGVSNPMPSGGDAGTTDDAEDDLDLDFAKLLADSKGDSNSDMEAGEKKDDFPPFIINHRAAIQSVDYKVLGRAHVSEDDLNSLLKSCGLSGHTSITFNMMEGILAAGAKVLRERVGRKGSYSWAQMCPEQLLFKNWSLDLEGKNAPTVRSINFVPPKHTHSQSKNQGGIEAKRRALCVAAHTSPFWRAVMVDYFVENPAPQPTPKRPRGASNAFVGVGGSSKAKKKRISMFTPKNAKPPTGGVPPTPLKTGVSPAPSDAAAAARAAEVEAAQAAELQRQSREAAAAGWAAQAAAVAAARTASRALPSTGAVAPRDPGAPPSLAGADWGGFEGPRLYGARRSGGVGVNLPPASYVRARRPEILGPYSVNVPTSALTLEDMCAASERFPVHKLAAMEPAPTLLSDTPIDVVQLPSSRFYSVEHSERRLRVVLPRSLLSEATKMLLAANVVYERRIADAGTAGGSLSLASSPGVSAAPVEAEHPALRMVFSHQDAAFCTMVGLQLMASALAFNETVQGATAFLSWAAPYQSCTDAFPAQLRYVVGAPCSVAEASKCVGSAVAGKLAGDPVWQYEATEGGGGQAAYGGLTVTAQDVLSNGQRAFLTNAVLDASLVEVREVAPQLAGPLYVLTTSQSSAFTSVGGQRVSAEEAVKRMVEIFEVMPVPHVLRFLMLMNLSNTHWISVDVFVPGGQVVVFDSYNGSCSSEKTFRVERVLLFASQYSRWLLARDPSCGVSLQWQPPSYVNEPVQRDGDSCGAFSLAHLWCVACDIDLRDIYVVGDHLRMGLLFTVVTKGFHYDALRAGRRALVA